MLILQTCTILVKERLYIFIASKIVGCRRSVGDSTESCRINHFLKLFFRCFRISPRFSTARLCHLITNTKKRFWTILAFWNKLTEHVLENIYSTSRKCVRAFHSFEQRSQKEFLHQTLEFPSYRCWHVTFSKLMFVNIFLPKGGRPRYWWQGAGPIVMH